eukprot:CAMPEP_0116563462 /NCGR_PEP_ID=MMETSP0397-20121206/12750_1 /TAXON_ID=216820 /ORGANISM="Cyclophora tenuis, Strain ECT3854" /LENGTH=351 /DNA_ID=CAMNT_0004089915 /DNA_START=150 /DNA_END=1205 /DNA_ORIENTATION=-
MDSTALVGLGQDFNTLGGSDSVDAKDILTLFAGTPIRALSPFPYWNIPIIGQYLDGLGWAHKRLRDSMSRIIDAQQQQNNNQTTSAGSDTFVKKVVEQNQQNSSFHRGCIIGNMITIFFAGSDSSMSTLCSIVQTLAQDETNLQEEIYSEIIHALPDDLDEVTLEDLGPDRIPRLMALLYEVLRFYTPFPNILLYTDEEIPFCGTTLAKGTHIFALLRYVMKNPHTAAKDVPLGPNGEPSTVFCPRRYLLTGGDGSGGVDDCAPMVSVRVPERNSTSFLSFGHGSRVCLGKALAEASIALTVATLVRTFTMKLAPNHAPIGRIKMLAEVPDVDIRVMFTPRETPTTTNTSS